jgi:hypothetical protein
LGEGPTAQAGGSGKPLAWFRLCEALAEQEEAMMMIMVMKLMLMMMLMTPMPTTMVAVKVMGPAFGLPTDLRWLRSKSTARFTSTAR